MLLVERKLYASQDFPREMSVIEEGVQENGDTFIRWQRIDKYWGNVLKEVDVLNGDPKYPRLGKLAIAALTLSHGQAHVERGFSKNKDLLTRKRSSISIETVNGLRTVQDTVKRYGQPADVPINFRSIIAFRNANKKYKDNLAEKKAKSIELEKEREKKRSEETKRKSIEEQESLARQRNYLEEQLKNGHALVKEASVRLKDGCQTKNMTGIIAAQVLLESGNKLLSKVTTEMEEIDKKIKNKKQKK